MPNRRTRVPKYRHHRPSGQAVVTLSGHDHYLGKHNTKKSREEYARLLAQWEASDRRPLAPSDVNGVTVAELCVAYWRFAKRWYVKDGRPTEEQDGIKAAIRPLKELFGYTPAVEFGPLALKAVRQRMIDAGQCRGYVNQNVGRIKRMFKWAVAEEMVPPHVHQALAAVSGLAKGKTEARETEPVQPVDEATIEATLKHINPVAGDMIRLQRLTGMRPGEVIILRPSDVDRSGDVWEYRPASHKMEHKGRSRVIYVGPKAQAILAPYLLKTEPEKYCFRPPRKRRAPRYTLSGYRTAIWRACERAFPPAPPLARMPNESDIKRRARLTDEQRKALDAWNNSVHWSPNRLRHCAGTEVRSRFGLEGAQVILGHAHAAVTQVYAERDAGLAAKIARAIG